MRSYEMFWNKQEEGKIAEASHKEGKQKEVNTRLYMLTGIWRDCVCVCAHMFPYHEGDRAWQDTNFMRTSCKHDNQIVDPMIESDIWEVRIGFRVNFF